MGINPKWNDEKTEVTLSKEDWESLQENLNGNFNKGYAKGTETGRKEVLGKFDFLELDPEDLDGGIAKIRKNLVDAKEGKIPDEILSKKISESDVVKQLQAQLSKKDEILQSKERDFDSFKRQTLIDQQLLNLGAAKDHEAVNPKQAAMLFASNYQIDVTDGNKLIIKNENGTPMFDEKGDEMPLGTVYAKFARENKHLFKAASSGGSGGGGNGGIPDGVSLDDFKSQEQKTAFIKQHGVEAYQKLVDAKISGE